MITKLCARCKRVIVYPLRYCDVCRPIVEREIAEREAIQKQRSMNKYNRQRDPKYSQFYHSKDWRMLSARTLQDHSWRCDQCGGLAVEVHHITPIQTPEGWDHRFDQNNLMCLCVKCHNDQHDRFKRKRSISRV